MSTEARFAGKVALVTGGASGIGAAVVRRLAAEGCAAVVIADLNEESAEAMAAELPTVRPARVDVSRAADVDAVVDATVAEHGRLDVVIHAAGVDDPASKALLNAARAAGTPIDALRTVTDDTWRRLMAVNLDGTFHVLRAAARVMVPRGEGAVVTVSSSAAFDTLTGYGPYAASKAGAQALTQAAAKELIAFGVRVNAVAPGPVDTPMASRTPDGLRSAMNGSGVPGYAAPEEIADSICYLASPAAANVVGAVLLSNGGRFTVS
ncbi:SDR family NAD(P)-dependent oxidoreductase [Nocardioides sp. CPCC 206347]|uniref:SDR family NAD(P)-dependent oxidoreductase n=2 Tax=Nocardioides TaxID=1839 RepID=UPI003B43BFBE